MSSLLEHMIQLQGYWGKGLCMGVTRVHDLHPEILGSTGLDG